MNDAPAEVIEFAERRLAARADRNFQLADELRDQIANSGWLVADTTDGFKLSAKPPFEIFATIDHALAQLEHAPAGECGVGIIVDGWPEDVNVCLTALMSHAPTGVVVTALDLGNIDGAGLVAHEMAALHPEKLRVVHVGQSLDQVGWGKACGALIDLDLAAVHVVMDLSSVLTGDAITPLLDALAAPGVVGAGWQGADVDIADWRSVVAAGPGEVDVLLGYLFAVDSAAARATPPSVKAKFYRNADLEWSLMLRAAGGHLVVPPGVLSVEQARHRGYHDSDPKTRERESKKNYDRLLQQFRGRVDLLAPRSS